VLDRVQLQVIYWGSDWNARVALRTQLDTATKAILSSNYIKALSEYRNNIGAGALAGSQVYVWTTEPSDNFSDDQVQQLLRDMINAQKLPVPGRNNLNIVMLPPGVSHGNVLGEHFYFTYDNQQAVHYGWVTAVNGLVDDYTCTLSHELVEAITDPEMDGILFSQGCAGISGTCEIGDVCGTCYALPDGTVVQDWYSARDGRCTQPT